MDVMEIHPIVAQIFHICLHHGGVKIRGSPKFKGFILWININININIDTGFQILYTRSYDCDNGTMMQWAWCWHRGFHIIGTETFYWETAGRAVCPSTDPRDLIQGSEREQSHLQWGKVKIKIR